MPIRFSRTELKDLTKAWVVVSIAFGIVLSYGQFGWLFFLNTLLAAITVGTGFLLHELGHKVVAQRYGCFAEFRADTFMLFLAIITALFGFIFAAPGAVLIAGHVSKSRTGKIAIAGPLVNITLAIVSLLLSFFVTDGFFGKVVLYGLMINSWLAVFNLLPFWILDGKKVFVWSKWRYFITLGIAVLLFLSRYILSFPATV